MDNASLDLHKSTLAVTGGFEGFQKTLHPGQRLLMAIIPAYEEINSLFL